MIRLSIPRQIRGLSWHDLDSRGGGGAFTDKPIFAFLRTWILYLVLEKEIGPRLFLPQGGALADGAQNRIVYYAEFLLIISILVMAVIHARKIAAYMARNPELLIYLAITFFVALTPRGEPNKIVAINAPLLLLEPLLALSLVILHDGRERAQKILSNFFAFALVANAAAVLVPSTSFMTGDLAGAYRGFMIHRGDLAFMLTIAIIITFVYRPPGLPRNVLLGLGGVMLLATGSAQGAILTPLGLAMVMFLRRRGAARYLRGGILLTASILVTALFLFVPDSLDDFFEIFGRDSSFTGRDRLWAMADYMIEHSYSRMGSGFYQFSDKLLPLDVQQAYGVDFLYGTTHSSYYEAFFTLGIIGGSIFLLVVAHQAFAWIVTVFGFREIQDPVPLVFTLFCVIGGFTAAEKMFLPGAGWFCFMMAKTLLDAERRSWFMPVRSWRPKASRPGPSANGAGLP